MHHVDLVLRFHLSRIETVRLVECAEVHYNKKLVDGKKLQGSKKFEWIERYCADVTTKKIYYPQNYHMVKPYDRIFVWPKDVVEAVARMNLEPGGTD